MSHTGFPLQIHTFAKQIHTFAKQICLQKDESEEENLYLKGNQGPPAHNLKSCS